MDNHIPNPTTESDPATRDPEIQQRFGERLVSHLRDDMPETHKVYDAWCWTWAGGSSVTVKRANGESGFYLSLSFDDNDFKALAALADALALTVEELRPRDRTALSRAAGCMTPPDGCELVTATEAAS